MLLVRLALGPGFLEGGRRLGFFLGGGRQRFQAFRDAFAFSGQLGSLMKKG